MPMRSFLGGANQPPQGQPPQAAAWHPMTLIREWFTEQHQGFRLADALTGVSVFGATGSGKTSGPAKHLAIGYLAAGFGGLVLCAKKEERRQWEQWAAETGRTGDLVIIDAAGTWRFNFLDWEAKRPGEGGGLTINIVALLDEIAAAVASGAGGDPESGGDAKFFEDALHHLNTNLVDLAVFTRLPLTLDLLRKIVTTAPQSIAQMEDTEWAGKKSFCMAALARAELRLAEAGDDPEALKDFQECKIYWTLEFPNLSEKTRSIIVLMFSMLARPILSRPLRRLFADDTNITPEAAHDGKVIIVDLPVQEYRLVGRIANLIWKYCFQVATLRRSPPLNGYLRPSFLWCDEAQNFVSRFDAEYQAVARSAGGCTVYLTQNRESYRRVLKDDDSVDALLGNLQCKIFCQNTGGTNEWAAGLLGEAWVQVYGSSIGHQQAHTEQGGHSTPSAGVNISEQRKFLVEPSRFTTLRRGGPKNNFLVDCIVYNGGEIFPTGQSHTLLTFTQR